MQCAAPLMTRYYCAVFYFARGSERENILSDTDAAFVATALILCLKKIKRFITVPKNCTNEDHKVTQENLPHS